MNSPTERAAIAAAADSSHKDKWEGEISPWRQLLSDSTATEVPSEIALRSRGMADMAGLCGEMERVIGWMRPREEMGSVATWAKREMEPSRCRMRSSCVNQQNSAAVGRCFRQLALEPIGTTRVLAPFKLSSRAVSNLSSKKQIS